ncbi:alanyl-tRNA synthetase [Bacillus sp. LL01]|uniref:serine-tRNA(Ala) deacylase AlaX n=1 Tax=Bacillus sp. LL01 TaxID=1665556 RepID=UPI00064D5DED|nr:serine-tRNA(Ala) deacylase AlaX [Bacillus sp. LL01]KMJ56948.1 alanyl-tRNA synthetase [Bacillus sp. LL01]
MENKLYYRDPYIRAFKTILKKQTQDDSGKWYAILEETAFYPEGGGQPFDTGTLNGHTVLEVQEIGGEIKHYLERPLPETTEEITGEIDWERRYDHMQQHAGQHLLSAAFEELFSYKTKSFHLGKEVSSIDLDTTDLTEQEVLEAEALVNKIILENRNIETKWVTKDELSDYLLRKELTVLENIRLVIIPDFDYNGCGGTHPNSTGEVATLKILSLEKQRKMLRVTFVAGSRVLKQLHEKQKVISNLSMQLNAPQQNMGEAVARLIEQAKALKEAKDRMLQYEAFSLVSNLKMIDGRTVIKAVFLNRSIGELQSMARHITQEVEDANVFLVVENEDRLAFVAARGNKSEVNMKAVAQKVLPAINGKGGGSESFVQGGGEANVTGDEMLKLLYESM